MPRTPPDPRHHHFNFEDLRAPNALLLAMEGRAPWEYAALLAATPWLRKLPRGDGHPVLVFPGLGANDFTTGPLRRFLDELGYVTHPWGQGFNFGPRQGVLKRCNDDVRRLFNSHARKVSLIGWSLGGIYARELAKLHPELVRTVITLGTPFSGAPESTNAWRLFRLTSGRDIKAETRRFELPVAPPVPTTSIWSRSDGIVAWQGSLQKRSRANPNTENIEVIASHLGIGTNPSAMWAVADRLAQPEGAWRPFERQGLLRGLLYPNPAR